ncbi:M48 family metallopeptidase [Anabaena sp. CCY 9402-a]|uniref:M48 family metallopeptidase n=1 Tax=Anabaena sp. CCY 9402-a TaxID=3103867 RepID=UPI0039C69715
MTKASQVAQGIKLSLILTTTTSGLLLGANISADAKSKIVAHHQIPIKSIQIAQQSPAISRFQTLAEADELHKKGQLQAAEILYRKVKPEFPPGEKRRTTVYEIEQLPGDAQVYWRNANEGLRQNLDTNIFESLQRLTTNYSEFIPGHLLLAEACKKKVDACKKYAKSDQPKNSLEVLVQAGELYPDEPDLLKAKIKTLESEKQFLDAAIAARQFAIIYINYPEAPEFEKIAEKNLQRHKSELNERLRTQGIFNTLVGAVTSFKTQNWQSGISGLQTLAMLSQGESVFGKSLADKYVEQYRQQSKLVDDPQVLNYVKGISNRLTALMGRDFEYEYYVIKDNSVNAFAVPGGKIFIHTGAIMATNSEAELAGLLSHEIAHAVLSHGFQRVTQSQFISSLSNVIPLSDMLQEMVGKEHSRENERQADILGARVLSKAGYAADGLRNLMVTLNTLSGGKERTTWQSTHPAPTERVQYLESLIQRNNYNRYTYEGVKQHKEIQNLLQGISPTANDTPAVSQPSDKKPATGSQNTQRTKPIRGVVEITGGQTRENVEIRLDGGKVESDRNFSINFIVENGSDRAFGFVPLYAQVVTEGGKRLTTKFSSAEALVPAGGTMKGTVQVLGQAWKNQGSQNLTLVIKESTSGGRVFRISF